MTRVLVPVYSDNYWRVRVKDGELERNRETFSITDDEYTLASGLVTGLLIHVVNHDALEDVKRIRQTSSAWRRLRVNDLRIIFEPKHEKNRFTGKKEPVLIWHALLRKNMQDEDPDWIYDYAQYRQYAEYPVKIRDRKFRLTGE